MTPKKCQACKASEDLCHDCWNATLIDIKVVFRFEDNEYACVTKYPSLEHAQFMLEEHNGACDCHRSSLIQACCNPDFPTFYCGDAITLVSLEV